MKKRDQIALAVLPRLLEQWDKTQPDSLFGNYGRAVYDAFWIADEFIDESKKKPLSFEHRAKDQDDL